MHVDFFDLFRWVLAIIATVYATVVTLQSTWTWYVWLCGSDKYISLARRYLIVHGLRLRVRTFGGDVLGTQFLSSLGVGYDALDRGLLRVTLEAYVAPYLSTRTVILPDGTRVVPGTLVPAEWMLSVRTRLESVELGLGGGTGIPFSSEARVAPSGTQTKDTFAPVTTPEFRFAFTFRYLFPGSKKR